MIGCVCGPIGSSMPSLIAGVPGPPDADDPAVLDPDVGLDDADDGIDDERAGDDDVELRRAGVAPGSRGAGGSSRSPRSARRRAPGGPRRPGPRGRCRRGGRGRRSSGRSGRGAPRGESAAHRRRLAAVPDQAHGPRLAGCPALGRAGRQVEVEAGRRLAVEHEPPVDPLERVVRRDADRRASTRCGPRGSRRGRGRSVVGGRPSPAGSRPGPSSAVPSGSMQHHEPRPVVHQDLERDLVDERADAVEHLRSGSTAPRPAASTSVVRGPGPRRLEHRVADERDRLGGVQERCPPRDGAGPVPRR